MGGTLTGASGAPSFSVWAMKEPDGANLDRIQIVKGWVDAKGEPRDRVFDVVWSGDRKPGKDGKVPAVGNTVDTTKATYTNTIGSPELIGSWTDKTFDAKQHALYYVRVLLIPTPHGAPTTRCGPACRCSRAWRRPSRSGPGEGSSPIWYTPGK